MCTAISMKTSDHYFGRTLDLNCSYDEKICIMPRKYPIILREMGEIAEHYAMIGMATVVKGTPLFYDAVNEYGLAMAGLNFPENAVYFSPDSKKDNITPFEFIPWVLGNCKSIENVKELLKKINLINIPFSDKLPLSPLHWMISDNRASIVVETSRDGLHIYDNPVNVLTNNPPFPKQVNNLKKYKNLRTDNSQIKFKDEAYSQGMGAIGLPGDVSSMSRFVRAAFSLENSVCRNDELSSVSQFFHILSSVSMIRGICITDDKTPDITVYTSCMNTDRGLYYYTTYENRQITCVDMNKVNLDTNQIITFLLIKEQNIIYQQ